MRPFWAVRRMTYQQLERERAKPLPASVKVLPRFNCILKNIACSSTNVAAIGEHAVNCTRMVDVPMMTNDLELSLIHI